MKQKLVPFTFNGERQSSFLIDPVTKILYFKKGHAGQKIKFSTKFRDTDFIKAKRFANQEFNRRIGKSQKIVPRTLIKDELKQWLAMKESEGWAYDTMNNIRRAKMQIEEFWGPYFPHQVTRDNLTNWYGWWAEKHSDIDMENAIKYLRNFCRYLAQKLVDDRPMLSVVPDIKDPNYKNIRRRRKLAKENIISPQDFKRIVATAENESHKLIVMIMYTMATRVTETLEMSFGSEVVFENQWIYRWRDGQNKADLNGWHELHGILVKPLTRLARSNRDTKRLFPQKGDTSKALREQQIDWAAWRERAALPYHWTPHTFRHTCLSNLFNDAENSQALICLLYRVSLAVAMESYIKPTPAGRAKMAKAIKVEL